MAGMQPLSNKPGLVKNLLGCACTVFLVLLTTAETAPADTLLRLGDEKRGVVSDFAVVNLAVRSSIAAGCPWRAEGGRLGLEPVGGTSAV